MTGCGSRGLDLKALERDWEGGGSIEKWPAYNWYAKPSLKMLRRCFFVVVKYVRYLSHLVQKKQDMSKDNKWINIITKSDLFN